MHQSQRDPCYNRTPSLTVYNDAAPDERFYCQFHVPLLYTVRRDIVDISDDY